MAIKREFDRRSRLRDIAEGLLEVARDGTLELQTVTDSHHAATCSKCSDYVDEVFMTLVVKYKR